MLLFSPSAFAQQGAAAYAKREAQTMSDLRLVSDLVSSYGCRRVLLFLLLFTRSVFSVLYDLLSFSSFFVSLASCGCLVYPPSHPFSLVFLLYCPSTRNNTPVGRKV